MSSIGTVCMYPYRIPSYHLQCSEAAQFGANKTLDILIEHGEKYIKDIITQNVINAYKEYMHYDTQQKLNIMEFFPLVFRKRSF